jgi:tetratricopeptide (TPR) repeat protein
MAWQCENNYQIPASIPTNSLQFGSSGASISSYTVDSVGDNVNRKNKERQHALALESSHLVHKLKLRPFDVRSLHHLATIDYQREDYESTIKIINKLIGLGEASTQLLLILGKCFFRRWCRDSAENDLLLALGAYKAAVDNPDMAQYPSPTPWFEMVSILVRLGRYQAGMDVLGIVLTIFKSKQFEPWSILVQYNVAQILLLAGRLSEAAAIYRDLMLYNTDVTVTVEHDAVVLLPTRMLYGVLIVEMGRLTQLQGKHALAVAVYKENWLSISYSMKFGKADVASWLGDLDALKGMATLFHKENNFFMAAEYYGMAAELVSSSAHGNSGKEWMDISYPDRTEIIEMVLKRAELLAEVHSFKQAEFCAHFAVSRANGDLIVMARAGRCCRKDVPGNEDICDSSAAIVRAVIKIQWALRSVFWRIKNKLKRRRILKATKIVSFIRMCIVRNRTISPRLSATSARHLAHVALRLEKVAFKSGKKVIQDYFVIWNAASKMIQRLIGNWLRRRNWSKFWNGVQILKKLMKGQYCRRLLRQRIEIFIKHQQNDMHGGIEANNVDANMYYNGSNNSSPEQLFSQCIRCNIPDSFPRFASDEKLIERLSSGTVVLTGDNILSGEKLEPAIAGRNSEAVSGIVTSTKTAVKGARQMSKKASKLSSKQSLKSVAEVSADAASSVLTDDTAVKSAIAATGSVLRPLHRSVRSIPPAHIARSSQAKAATMTALVAAHGSAKYSTKSNLNSPYDLDTGATAIFGGDRSVCSTHSQQSLYDVLESKLDLSLASISMDESIYLTNTVQRSPAARKKRLLGQSVQLETNDGQSLMNHQESGHLRTLTQLNFQASAVSVGSSNHDSLGSVVPINDLQSRAQDGFAWFQRPSDNVAVDASMYRGSKRHANRGLVSMSEISAAFALTQVPLPQIKLDRAPTTVAETDLVGPTSADIVTQISIGSMYSVYGPRVKWIPFAILPDSEITKLLTCTILSITSPSFTSTDCKRLARIARIHQQRSRKAVDLWSRMHSLVIYGTRMGESGLSALAGLGFGHLTSLTIGYTEGLTHKVMLPLAQQLRTDADSSCSNCKLTKLYIEGEHLCGDRGIVLLFKYLQYNSTLKHLTIRDCGLSTRGAHACARYLGVTQSLASLNMNDNHFSLEDVLCLIRAVATLGPRGCLQDVSVVDQFPPLTATTIRAAHQYGTSLGIRVESKADILDVVYDTQLEQSRPDWMHDDVRWNNVIQTTVELFKKDGTFLQVGQNTRYSKKITL